MVSGKKRASIFGRALLLLLSATMGADGAERERLGSALDAAVLVVLSIVPTEDLASFWGRLS